MRGGSVWADDPRAALNHGRQELEGKHSPSYLCVDGIGKHGHWFFKILRKWTCLPHNITNLRWLFLLPLFTLPFSCFPASLTSKFLLRFWFGVNPTQIPSQDLNITICLTGVDHWMCRKWWIPDEEEAGWEQGSEKLLRNPRKHHKVIFNTDYDDEEEEEEEEDSLLYRKCFSM